MTHLVHRRELAHNGGVISEGRVPVHAVRRGRQHGGPRLQLPLLHRLREGDVPGRPGGRKPGHFGLR